MKQISNLVKLQLKNLYGINVIRHTTDKKVKKRKLALAVVYAVLAVMICFYMGAAAYGYIALGLGEMVPAYLVMVSSLLILFFAILKAGNVIFQKESYDILCSLPVSQAAIVVSRFVRMYVENLLLVCGIMLPGILVYGVMIRPGISFYLIGFIVTVFVPLIPITIAAFLGALITAIASRMKHKNLVSVVLSLLLFGGIMLGTSQMKMIEDDFSVEMLQSISDVVLTLIKSIYPPAIWMGNAMLEGNFVTCLLCVVGGEYTEQQMLTI